MLKIILLILGLLLCGVSVTIIYDARRITKNIFGFGDQNEATSGLKILGFIIGIIGVLLIYFNH